jgi:HlyD family secretion protein
LHLRKLEGDLNIGAPEARLAVPRKRRRSSWPVLRALFFFVCFAAIFAYVVAYYVIPKSVAGMTLNVAPVALEIAGPALLDARNKVTVTARIPGYLKTINVDRNDEVKIGEVLAELDSADLANQLVAAEADAKAAESAIAEAASDQQRASAVAEKARQDYGRKIKLKDLQVISEADWSATEAAYHQTQAELARSTTTILKATAQSASANANVKLLKVRLNYATITSPLNGVVVSRDRSVGDLLSPGTSLLQLVDPTSIILVARLDESAMGLVGAGQQVLVQFASIPQEQIKGTVSRLVRLVDQETREFTLEITPNHLPDHWALGQRANVLITAADPSPTLAIPEKMLARRNGRVGAWRVQDGRAEWTKVDLGYPSGDNIQVINGLEAGDVILPPDNAYDYMPVAVKAAAQ